ncbi:hypothetical protein R5R35_003230 [Gryllus longicercus]|uniref:Uncharacterized protein n=1 Tax=Gryllus longicercus TaxID=2509291 RepID=A0AAN9W0A6_9ORTH
MRMIDELKTSNKMLMEEMKELKNSVLGTKDEKATFDMEAICAEVIDREKRSKNIIIYNVTENINMGSSQRLTEDKQQVIQILNQITEINPNELIISRIGNVQKNKNETSTSRNGGPPRERPIKVTFPNSEQALFILRNKKNKISNDIRIGSDKTRIQREYFKQLLTRLNAEEEKGNSNLIIKYIDGIPKLIDKPVKKSCNNQEN